MKLRVILEPSEESGYTAIVSSLPGCISEGKTREEALKNIRQTIELYLEPVDDDMHSSENAVLSMGKKKSAYKMSESQERVIRLEIISSIDHN